MRESEADRHHATLRCPEFIEDRNRLSELYAREGNGPYSAEAKAFNEYMQQKWDILPLTQHGDYVNGDGAPEIKIWERPAFDMVSEQEWARVMRIADSTYGKRPLSGIPLWITSGKTLYTQVAIDLGANETDVIDRFHEAFKAWKTRIISNEEQKQRNKRFTLSIWEIYDLKQSGLSYDEIARRKSGLTGNAVGNEDLDKVKQAVKRAYKKAASMIQAVSV